MSSKDAFTELCSQCLLLPPPGSHPLKRFSVKTWLFRHRRKSLRRAPARRPAQLWEALQKPANRREPPSPYSPVDAACGSPVSISASQPLIRSLLAPRSDLPNRNRA